MKNKTINPALNFQKIAFFLLIFFYSFTEIRAQNIQQLGPNYFAAGLPSYSFQYYAVTQRKTNWCWAACIQMVLNYEGLYVTQEDIVMRCFGSLEDRPGGPAQMFTALNGWAYNIYGGISNIYTNNYQTNVYEIQAFLASNKPLIVGLNQQNSQIGHAYVLTGIYYYLNYDYYGNQVIIPEKVVLRDPWPLNPSRQEMSWQEFANRVNMCYKVWVN